jgi:hypothetical protein
MANIRRIVINVPSNIPLSPYVNKYLGYENTVNRNNRFILASGFCSYCWKAVTNFSGALEIKAGLIWREVNTSNLPYWKLTSLMLILKA